MRFSDPDDPSKTIGSPLGTVLDESDKLNVLVGAKHDAIGPIISNIAITASASTLASPTVSWTTNENATSWIDWGLTTAYELGNESLPTPFGNNTLATAHSIQMSGLALGTTYHYRIRTTDALGNSTYSADRTYKPTTPPPTPLMSDVTTQTGPDGWGPIPVELTCSVVASSDGHAVIYEFQLGTGTVLTSNTPSYIVNLSDGTYTVHVRARDAVDTAAVSAWSAYDTFVVNNADPSCPTLYTWDGTTYRFVTDVMGLGSVGVKKGPSAYLVPEPVEDSVIPQGALIPRDGKLDIRLTDEKAEVEFVDEVSLRAVDHPAGTRLLTNDLHWGAFDGGREPTEYFTISDPKPVAATYERIPVLGTEAVPETDVSPELAVEGDGEVAYSGLYDDNIWTFDLGKLGDPAQIKLVLSGWVDYANRAEKTAWLESGKRPPASFMEVQDANGEWIAVGDAPHPPGYPKTVVYDLSDVFPDGVTDYKVRMRIYMRMNVDYVGVDTTPDAAVKVTELLPVSAELSYKGLSQYSGAPYPTFTYDDISPVEPRLQTGAFTRYGDVLPLLKAADDMFVVMNTGDDLGLTFDEPAAPAAGTVRSYMIHTDGFHQTISGSVDPMPFHGMSNYPYPSEEHYPDDAEHSAYLAEWNTRVVNPVPAPEIKLSGFKEMHVTGMIVASTGTYSLVSDQLLLTVTRADGSVITRSPVSGWESASSETAKPTPTAPGVEVGAAEIAALVADDGSGWTTSMAVADGIWDWQLMQFDLSDIPVGDIKSVNVLWNGHGGPNAGYDTAVYTWNPVSPGWTSITKRMMIADTSVAASTSSLDPAFCLRCHDGLAPSGVVIPPGLVNIGARWNLSTGDFHGARAGSGVGTTGLKAPYARGQGPIGCPTCHDTHGTGSLYHIPAKVNGQTVATVAAGSDYDNLCSACHVGNAGNWHPDAGCWCHISGDSEHGLVSVPLNNEMDCSMCHFGHKSEFVHNCNDGCH
ncbi:MAG: hypothetical protein CVT66_08425 [Actinobacteria bacterium HGW-Actinobacteria-6]|nr:MAG: hypothetical protein CVT66_08425 [Actinobacteria bacterium HGW-Actinobacteria-6]